MSIPEVLSMINSLPHSDKFKLVQLIFSQLAKEEGIYLEPSNTLNHLNSKPKPIGKVYYSGHSDISTRAKQLLFQEKIETIRQRYQS